MNNVITVSQVNTYIKSLLDGSEVLKHAYISGEISNLTNHYKSGHIYFSLKDDRSVIKVVMFASSTKRLKFLPKDGMKILVRGRISVYEASGQYQIYVEDMQPDGIGALNLAYEQLRDKLLEEGLFSDAYKNPLPHYPQKIALITSTTGAAVQDMLRILNRRWPVAEIILCPCNVQGSFAVPELIDAVISVNNNNSADVIIIGRGGGSLEDLWAFNDETLARTIFASHIPVVSAVGHETDFTICDFVADQRASTPSAAAVLVTPEIFEESVKIKKLTNNLHMLMTQKISNYSIRLDSLSPLSYLEMRLVEQKRDSIDRVAKMISLLTKNRLSQIKNDFSAISGKLDALSPLKILSRGYSILSFRDDIVISVDKLTTGDKLTATLSNGKLELIVDKVEKNND